MKKVIVITGTSSGLGASLSIQLAKEGHTVYATMRNLDKQAALISAADTAGVKIKIKQLDVLNTDSVNRCIGEIIKMEGKIDCLVNNAGAGFIRNTEQASEEEIKWVMDVNYMGMVRCVKAVLPFMREMKSGQIINISSVGGLVGQPFNELYCAAKFAVEGYTESLATYVQPHFNIKFTVVEPGGIQTEFVNNVLSVTAKSGGLLQDEYLPLLSEYMEKPRTPGAYQSADEVAAVVVRCIQSENPPLRIRTSEWAEQFCQYKTQSDPDGVKLRDQVFNTFYQ